jgi:hypothetical protein
MIRVAITKRTQYRLTCDVPGIGFKTADVIAMRPGTETTANDPSAGRARARAISF